MARTAPAMAIPAAVEVVKGRGSARPNLLVVGRRVYWTFVYCGPGFRRGLGGLDLGPMAAANDVR